MKMLLYKWYDHELVWEFYDRAFKQLYIHYDKFEQSSWEVDVYDGVDGEVIFVNDTLSIPTQIKTSGKLRQYNLSVNLAYTNENGDDSAFGLYFNDDRIDNIKMFAFGFPFLGRVLFIDFDAFWTMWVDNFNNWVDTYGNQKGLNKYLTVPITVLLRDIYDTDYIMVSDIEAVNRQELER